MNVLTMEPNEEPKEIEIDGSIESIEEAIGGYIETIRMTDDLLIIANEESRLKGSYESKLVNGYGIVGTFIIVGNTFPEKKFRGLTNKELKMYKQIFKDRIINF